MNHSKPRRAFSLIELLIVVTITATLAAVVMPMFRAQRDKALGDKCMSNLKELGRAMKLYGNDWDGRFPVAREGGTGVGKSYLFLVLQPYTSGGPELMECPADTGAAVSGGDPTPLWKGQLSFWSSYAWPAGYPSWVHGLPQDNPRRPGFNNWVQSLPLSRRPVLFDHYPWHRAVNAVSQSWASGSCSTLYCDGHAGSQRRSWLLDCMMGSGTTEPRRAGGY